MRVFFRWLSMESQAAFMKRRGIILGTRERNGRQGYLYMVNNLFAEIFFENDNPQMDAERIVVMRGLENLNRYLEKDVRDRTYRY